MKDTFFQCFSFSVKVTMKTISRVQSSFQLNFIMESVTQVFI